jgi:hypothetical protein
VRTATTRPQHAISHASKIQRCHAKVRDLDVLLLVEKEVLRLEISMADVEPMAVVETSDDLLKVERGFVGL